MAVIYSTRFLSGKGGNGSFPYVVPTGYVVVLRDVDVYADVVGASQFFLQGDAGQAIWWNKWDPGDAGYGSWRGRQIMYAGETFTANCDAAPLDGIDYAVSGYLLTAP
jgi:hypothetical protein